MKSSPRLFSRNAFYSRIQQELESIKKAGLYKDEQVIASPQESSVLVQQGKRPVEMINFCANNYLGLSNHPELCKAGLEALQDRGVGLSSVRFICGTLDVHKRLERQISNFHGTQDTILYTSCFDANAGLFETLLGPDDAILSDSLNHASIIDGVRLCKAQRLRYKHGDMAELEALLREHQWKAKSMLIATDGVFSMDGDFAQLPGICRLAEKYDALVFVDDSHATGFIGKDGKGTPEYFGVEQQVDLISSTLGKALGGSSGGYTTGKQDVIDLLRQKSRPYLFSNSVAPVIAAFASRALDIVREQPQLRERVMSNTEYFQSCMRREGYKLMGNGSHPICPVLVGDAVTAGKMAAELRARGILVIAFSYPVVPKGSARIRVQISAAHTIGQIDQAVREFVTVGKKYNIIG